MEPKATRGYSGMMATILENQLTSQLMGDALDAFDDLADSPDHLDVPDATKYDGNNCDPAENLADRIEVGVDWGAISTMYKQLPGAVGEMTRRLASQLSYQWMVPQESEEPDYQYECVDDFGVKGQFSVGCIYVGHPYNSTMLSVENDQGAFVKVDKELFKEVG